MEFFLYSDFQIPAAQIILQILLSSFALLFGRIKLALLVNYIFVFYWGFLSKQTGIYDQVSNMAPSSLYAYLIFGLLIVIVALIGFLQED